MTALRTLSVNPLNPEHWAAASPPCACLIALRTASEEFDSLRANITGTLYPPTCKKSAQYPRNRPRVASRGFSTSSVFSMDEPFDVVRITLAHIEKIWDSRQTRRHPTGRRRAPGRHRSAARRQRHQRRCPHDPAGHHRPSSACACSAGAAPHRKAWPDSCARRRTSRGSWSHGSTSSPCRRNAAHQPGNEPTPSTRDVRTDAEQPPEAPGPGALSYANRVRLARTRLRHHAAAARTRRHPHRAPDSVQGLWIDHVPTGTEIATMVLLHTRGLEKPCRTHSPPATGPVSVTCGALATRKTCRRRPSCLTPGSTTRRRGVRRR